MWGVFVQIEVVFEILFGDRRELIIFNCIICVLAPPTFTKVVDKRRQQGEAIYYEEIRIYGFYGITDFTYVRIFYDCVKLVYGFLYLAIYFCSI